MTEINKNQKALRVKNALKNFSPSKTFIALTCITLGIGATLLAQNVVKAQQPRDPLLNIFAEMAAMEKNMNEVFASHQKQMDEIFAQAKKSGPASKSQVSSRQDKDNYYYELSFSGFKKEDVAVQFKDRVLTLSAVSGKEDQGATSFNYSFLAPQADVKKEPEVVRSDDKIVVTVKKSKGRN